MKLPGYWKEEVPQQETLDFNGILDVQSRTVIDIPSQYGKLVGIIPGELGVILWFQNDSGDIRNITLSPNDPIIIKRRGNVTVQTNGL